MVADCRVEAEAQGCRLVSRINQRAILMGDRELIRRACENVVRNAIRHAPARARVDVTLGVNDDLATIAIRDEGPGVPPESLAEIFKPFYRVEKSRERSQRRPGPRPRDRHTGRRTAQWANDRRNADPGLIVEIELPVNRSEDWQSR